MKRVLLLLCLGLEILQLHAQWTPWEIIQKGRVFCYVSGNTKLYLKIDSTETNTNYTRYRNYFRLRKGSGSSYPSQYYFVDSTDWTGRYIEQNNEKQISFFALNGKSFTIHTNGNTGYTWKCFDLPDSGSIIARIDTMTREQFLSINDSVKHIRFAAYDSVGNTFTHWLNNVTLRLSKNYGLLDVIHFNSPDTPAIYTLTGFTNPETNWGDLTAKQVFDIQPGDLRIIRKHIELNGPPFMHSTKYTRLKCIERTEFNNGNLIVLKDSIETIYIRYITNAQRYDTVYSNEIKTDSIQLDMYEFLNFLDYEVDAKTLTGSTYMLYHTNDLFYFNLPTSIRAKYYLNIYQYDDEKGVWPIPTDFPSSHVYYVEHMGGIFYVTPYITGGGEYSLPYYFKRGNFTCGNQDDWNNLRNLVSVKEMNSSTFNLYPNPVVRYLTLASANNLSQELHITFFSATGQQVFEKKIKGQESELDLYSLASGLYTYIITSSDGRTQRGKLCKQ